MTPSYFHSEIFYDGLQLETHWQILKNGNVKIHYVGYGGEDLTHHYLQPEHEAPFTTLVEERTKQITDAY
jgi:hypothetical protein